MARLAAGVQAQSDFPSKPIRIVVPFAAGGSTDVLGRNTAQVMSKALGQPVVVENRAGASGNIGAQSARDTARQLWHAIAGDARPAHRLHRGDGHPRRHLHEREDRVERFTAEDGAVDVVQVDAGRLGGVNEVLAVMLMAAKYGLKVCPHAGGVGLCEMVQHLSMIDYLCISGTREGRVAEYVDHLHEHFADPCVVRGAAYMPPERPGYSTEMKAASLEKYRFGANPA